MRVGFMKHTRTIGFQWRAWYPPNEGRKRLKPGFVVRAAEQSGSWAGLNEPIPHQGVGVVRIEPASAVSIPMKVSLKSSAAAETDHPTISAKVAFVKNAR
jgi:hypothetical protein